jgi:hypothetical protein
MATTSSKNPGKSIGSKKPTKRVPMRAVAPRTIISRGVTSPQKYAGHTFNEVDSDLSRDRDASRGKSTSPGDRIRAARDAWDLLNTR